LSTCGTSKPEVVRVLAKVLGRSCRRLSDLGFDWISIDEPFLSPMLGEHELRYGYDEHFVVEMLNMLIAEIPALSAIHVCGTVTPMVKKVLLESRANIVDHEFAAIPKNMRAYTNDDLEQTGKFLAYGCISSIKPSIETVEEILASVRKALDWFGPRIIVKPDCGFGDMQSVPGAYTTVLGKLRNMTAASRKLKLTKKEAPS
jgi:methionine synthase II (cobalamin-independent)